MSVHFSDTGTLMLGAPNVYLLGSVILYAKDFRSPFVVNTSTISTGRLKRDYYAYNGA